MSKDHRGLKAPSTKAQQEEALRQMRANAEPFARLFATDDGKAVLETLGKAFESQVCSLGMSGEDHAMTNARRDVVLYIRKQIEIGKGDQ